MVCLMNLTIYSSLDSYTSSDEEELTEESISTGMHVVNSCEPRMLVLAISVVPLGLVCAIVDCIFDGRSCGRGLCSFKAVVYSFRSSKISLINSGTHLYSLADLMAVTSHFLICFQYFL